MGCIHGTVQVGAKGACVATTTDLIKAIGGLWPLALVVGLVTLGLAFRTRLNQLLGRLTRAQLTTAKGTSLAVEAEPSASSIEGDVPSKMAATSAEEGLPKPAEEPSFFAMLDAFGHGRADEGKEEFEKLREAASDEKEKIGLEAAYLYLRHHYAADMEARAQLLALTHTAPEAAWTWLATLDSADGKYFEAYKDWEAAAGTVSDEEKRASYEGRAALALQDSGRSDEAIAKIETLLWVSLEDSARIELLKALAEIHRKRGELVMRAVALVLVTELAPNDPGLHFDTAFALSDEESVPSELALLHYSRLLAIDPDHTIALNNAGVQYERLGMRALSVSSYEGAAALGETLAMSNLANRYLAGGFVSDAQRLLDLGRAAVSPHPNIGSGLAALAELREGDEKQRSSVLETAKGEEGIIREYGHAFFAAPGQPANAAGEWVAESGKGLSLVQSANELVGSWIGIDRSVTGEVRNRGIRLASSEGGHAFGVIGEEGVSIELVAIASDRKTTVLRLSRRP
jgi:tetratricopeptide (TPR) repeat protein